MKFNVDGMKLLPIADFQGFELHRIIVSRFAVEWLKKSHWYCTRNAITSKAKNGIRSINFASGNPVYNILAYFVLL